MAACKEHLIKLCTNKRCKIDPRYSGPISGKRPSGPIESSGCAQVKLEPGHKARLAMFSARFNEKNKEACIAVAAWIQVLKLFGTHIQVKWSKNHQESFHRIVLLTKLQDCTAVGSWGHGNEVPRRAQASNGESLRNLDGGSRRGKDICTAHIQTPIFAQKPRLNLWLGFVFFWGLNTDFLLSPVCVLRFAICDFFMMFVHVCTLFCKSTVAPFYLNNSCGMQSFDSRFLTNLSSRSLQNKPKEQGTGVWGFRWPTLNTDLLNNNTHEVVPNDLPCEESPLTSQMPKQTKGIWYWAARFLIEGKITFEPN